MSAVLCPECGAATVLVVDPAGAAAYGRSYLRYCDRCVWQERLPVEDVALPSAAPPPRRRVCAGCGGLVGAGYVRCGPCRRAMHQGAPA